MPEKIGFLFPGQGAQYVGMGKDLYESFPQAKNLFEEADKRLGYSISQICFQGPEESLTRTYYAQPALFAASLAALAVLKEKFPDIHCDFTAGLSLGEFTALAASGSISFREGLQLVARRAEAMERCAQKYPGTMASILGLPQSDCEAVAREAGCDVANLNSPDQIVLSGAVETVEKACRLAAARGARRAIRLKVGGAFHSPLMQEARQDLQKTLEETKIQAPSCTFIPNAEARPVRNPEEIRGLLARQLTSPVRWMETMQRAQEKGITFFLEIGPGKVLKGLAKKCRPQFQVEPCGTNSDFKNLETLFAHV